ncbi:hypothetical protein LCGC14_2026320, partial [marine sediment metagenome]
YTLIDTDRWEFSLYGDTIIACTDTEPPQKYEVGTDTRFSDASAHAPKAVIVETVKEFTMVGDIFGRGNNVGIGGEGAVHWSEIGSPTSWPTVGTDAALAVESDYQLLEGDGGPITDIVAASTFTIVFRERQVWRADYVGKPEIFAFRKLDKTRGCVIPGAAISVGGLVYFPSKSGWLVTNGAQVTPIGHEKIDRWWKAGLSIEHISRISVAHSPSHQSIFWSVPFDSSTTPNLVIGYQYEIRRWYKINEALEWIVTVLPAGGSLDDAPYATQDMDVNSPTGLGDVAIDGLGGTAVELLGGFDPMIGSRPGWIVRVTSEKGKQWLIGVTPEPAKKFRVWTLNEVHWENWVGGLYPNWMYDGDNPDEYYKLCETAKLLRDKELSDGD